MEIVKWLLKILPYVGSRTATQPHLEPVLGKAEILLGLSSDILATPQYFHCVLAFS